MLKKSFTILFFVFCLMQCLFAQTLLPPEYSVEKTKKGYVYSFSCKPEEIVYYQVFDSFTGNVTTKIASAKDYVLVSPNDTVTAWTENSYGLQSRVITLGKTSLTKNEDFFVDVISPVEGTWANRQAFVVNASEGTEIYYSFNEIDPLDFGFAYDEPVLIDLDGEIELNIAAVHSNGSITKKKINYSVKENNSVKEPIKTSYEMPVILCGVKNPIPMPDTALYSLDDGKTFLESKTLSQKFPSCVDVTKSLLIDFNNSLYRYVIKTCDSPIMDKNQIKFLSSPLQVVDWNYIMFQEGENVRYSVDGGPWVTYTEPFYIDRSVFHTIRWSIDSRISSVDLPAKPHLTGLPNNGVCNTPVELQLSNSLYTFRIEKNGEFSKPLTSFYVDTFYGDEQKFNLSVPVYYGSIRQGELNFAFTIDKKPPEMPILTGSTTETYVRKPVSVSVMSKNNDTIYFGLQEIRRNFDFFEETEELDFVDEVPDDLQFLPLNASKVFFSGDEVFAVTYTLYSYSVDKAGNQSEVAAFRVTVDKNNFYLASLEDENDLLQIDISSEKGTPQNPFNSVQEAVYCVNSREQTMLHLKGGFYNLPVVQLFSDCQIFGHYGACLSFANDGVFKVKYGNVYIDSVMFEKPLDSKQVILESSGVEPFFSLVDAKADINNCEFVFNNFNAASIFTADLSTLLLKNSRFTILAQSYAAGVMASNSSVYASNVKFSFSAESAVGFTLSNSLFEINNAQCIFSAKRGRGAELYNCKYKLSSPSSSIGKNYLTVWKDDKSIQVEESLF